MLPTCICFAFCSLCLRTLGFPASVSRFTSIGHLLWLLTVTTSFRLLPYRWCRRFSPWQPSVFCQWSSLGWCHRCACHFSVCQAISFLDVLWVGFPSMSYVVCFLLCASRHVASHAHTIQKRCLRTIFPGHSYDEARSISNLPTLFERRTKLCQSYFRKMHNADHKLNKLLPNQRNISYDLRTYNTLPVPLASTDRFRRSLIPWGLANWQHNVL